MMKMSNSSLVSYTKLSPNHSGKRTHVIDTISVHCMAGNLSVETCGALFAKSSREASSNYGIGSDGRIALYVDEANRSWCTSSRSNDQRAITIEVANTVAADPWPISDAANKAYVDQKAPKYRTATLPAASWSDNSQTVTVNGVKASETAQLIQPMPAVASQDAYIAAGIIGSGLKLHAAAAAQDLRR